MKKLIILLLTITIFSCAESKKEEIPLVKTSSGVFLVEATFNGVATVTLLADTGATNTTIPLSLFYFLLDMGTVEEKDILSPTTSILADGSRVSCGRFTLKTLKVGNSTFKNVEVNVIGTQGGVLLIGQSTLERFGRVEFDYDKNVMIVD